MMPGETITCGCCGRWIRNTKEENVDFGEVPYLHDEGYGMCKKCESWAEDVFFSTRFKIVIETLSEEHRAKWEAWPLGWKKYFVRRMIEKGIMV